MRIWKTLIIMIIDIFMVNMAYLFAIDIAQVGVFRDIAVIYSEDAAVVSIIYAACFYGFKMYDSLWHLTGTDEFLLGVGGNILASILTIFYTRKFGSIIPLNVCVIATLLSIFFVLGYRILYRVYRRIQLYIPYKYSSDQQRVMIVGAGSAGGMIINEILARRELKYNPVVLIDDDKNKLGRRMSGVKIEGNRHDIPYIVSEKRIEHQPNKFCQVQPEGKTPGQVFRPSN